MSKDLDRRVSSSFRLETLEILRGVRDYIAICIVFHSKLIYN